MSRTFKCDICHEPVDPKEGKLHAIDECSTIYGDVHGFAFYDWSDEAASSGEYGHVHKACIAEQVLRYFRQFKWGRLLFRGKHIVISEEKLARRKRA